MQNSQYDNLTIAKLLEADTDLAAQEAELNAQIQSIEEKRHSLKNVIDMFAPVDNLNKTLVVTPAPTPVAEEQLQPTAPDVIFPELNGAVTDPIEAETPAVPQPQKRQAKKKSSPTSSQQSKKSSPAKKSSKATDTWQQYVKNEFSNASLAEAVTEVMQQHSKQVVEIAKIIDAIFTSNIPKEVRSTARERISNVLSVGAKNGKWYRGQLGKYSMSKAALKGQSAYLR